MNETIALTRFCLRKWQRSATILLMGVVFSVICVIATTLIFGRENSAVHGTLVPWFLIFAFGPAAFAALLIFEYGTSINLTAGGSSCHAWVLRMPIAAHKIALVPIAIRTLWVIALSLTLMATFFFAFDVKFDGELFAYAFAAVVTFAAGCIWFLGISWRPFTNGWWRLAVFALVGIVGWAWLVLVLSNFEHREPPTGSTLALVRPYVLPVSLIVTLAAYASGVCYAIHAIRLAKTQSHGIVSEAAGRRVRDSSIARRNHKTPRQAMRWFLIASVRPVLARTAMFLAPVRY